MDYVDIKNILEILLPYGINLILDTSVKDDLIFKAFVPKDSKVKRSNRYVKGDAAVRFVKDTINKYMDKNDIHVSYGIDFEEVDLTWTENMSEYVKQKLTN